MRTIQLTDEEITTIKTALQVAYDRCLEPIQSHRILWGEDAIDAMLARARSFSDVQSVFDGERDVEPPRTDGQLVKICFKCNRGDIYSDEDRYCKHCNTHLN